MRPAPQTTKRIVIATFALSSCGRNLEAFESADAVERASGGALCKDAQVMLKNKQELEASIQRDDMTFIISSSSACLDSFEKSLFDTKQLKACRLGTGSACIKKYNGDMISIHRRTTHQIELNRWS